MGVVLLNRDTLPEFLRRLDDVDGAAKPLWGKMNAPEMFAHLTNNIRMALEEVPTPDESSWFKRAVLRRLIFHVLPWPKGRIAALHTSSFRPKAMSISRDSACETP